MGRVLPGGGVRRRLRGLRPKPFDDEYRVDFPDGVAHRGADKFPTVRLIKGQLTAEARRLDGPAPPAVFEIPNGYGSKGFQALGVTFPTEGCWEITQRVGDRDLRFVVQLP